MKTKITLSRIFHRGEWRILIKSEKAGRVEKAAMKIPQLPEADDEIIPSEKNIRRVIERKRISPVEFRINEQDGRLAIRFFFFPRC